MLLIRIALPFCPVWQLGADSHCTATPVVLCYFECASVRVSSGTVRLHPPAQSLVLFPLTLTVTSTAAVCHQARAAFTSEIQEVVGGRRPPTQWHTRAACKRLCNSMCCSSLPARVTLLSLPSCLPPGPRPLQGQRGVRLLVRRADLFHSLASLLWWHLGRQLYRATCFWLWAAPLVLGCGPPQQRRCSRPVDCGAPLCQGRPKPEASSWRLFPLCGNERTLY